MGSTETWEEVRLTGRVRSCSSRDGMRICGSGSRGRGKQMSAAAHSPPLRGWYSRNGQSAQAARSLVRESWACGMAGGSSIGPVAWLVAGCSRW